MRRPMDRVRRRLLRGAVVAAGVTFAADASAYRPFDGTDAEVAAFGDFELELGPVHWYSQSGQHYVIAPAAILNLGILPRVELVVDLQNFVGIDVPAGHPRDQLVNNDVLLKSVLIPGVLQGKGTGPSMALEVGPLTPGVQGQNGFGLSANAIVTQRWGDFVMHVDSWFQLTRSDLHADWFEGVILEGEYDSAVRPVSEWFVEHEWVANVTTWSGLVGAIWRAREGLDFDMGLREARIGDDAATEVRLGLTWTIGVWTPPGEAGQSGHARQATRRLLAGTR
jgi:hypothetical protein